MNTELVGASARDEWNDFVHGHEEATLCHLFEWREILERSYRRRCYSLVLRDSRGVCGVLPLVHLRSPLAGNRLVSMPYLDLGGPLASTGEGSRALVEAAVELVRELRARGLDLRGASGQEPSVEPTSRRFRFELQLGESDEIWRRIGPKVRNQVRKSEKSGLVTASAPSSRLREFFAIFATNMHRLGSPVHSELFFASILAWFGELASLYLTHDGDGKTVAGGISIRFREVVTVPWASSLPEARSSCPNHSFYWRVLRDAAAGGAEIFDFGRSTEGTGTYRFKKQWNPDLKPLVWSAFDREGRPVEERSMSRQRNLALANLWSRIPEPLATRFGPRLRRELPN